MQQVRVPLFRPSQNGLHFSNDAWPPGEPDYTLSVLGQTITVGDAHSGLCGGMAYTVNDCFQTRLLPPADTVNPAQGTPLYNYIVARLTNSFDEPDVNQYLSWIQMSDHDTLLGHGLAWHEITEEWPRIQGDLDAGRPAALGLVHGQEPPTVGFFTGIQDLGGCHQVLAWGYDLDGTSLTIYIYDPDNFGDTNTITLDIGDPAHTTPLTVAHFQAGTFRGFFRTHYQYHDPRTPISGAFIATVVTSPGITSAGSVTEGDHFYTTSAAERDNAIARFGYHSEGTACYVFGQPPQDIVSFYRMSSPATAKHFYTTSLTERDQAIADDGYVSEQVACYVYATPAAGTTDLFRLFNPGNGDHFYTTSAAERDNAIAQDGYHSEGTACYVYAAPAAGTTELYRLLSSGNGDHFYTTSAAERDNAIARFGYHSEGTACYVFGQPPQDIVSFYRMSSPATAKHFYTTSLTERDQAIADDGYVSEQVACYVYATPATATTDLFRLFSPGTLDHFYTTSPAERDNAIAQDEYQSEGTACYVYAAPAAGITDFFRLYNG